MGECSRSRRGGSATISMPRVAPGLPSMKNEPIISAREQAVITYVWFYGPRAKFDPVYYAVCERFGSRKALRNRLDSLVKRGYLEKDSLADLWSVSEKGTKELRKVGGS